MAPTRRVTVAVVDDHDVVLSGVRAWIDGDPRPIEIVDTATSLGQGGDKGFFKSQAQTHIAHALEMLFELSRPVTLLDAYELLSNRDLLEEEMENLENLTETPRRAAVYAHFLDRFLTQPAEQFGGVRETIGNYLQYFLTPEVAEVFCAGESTFDFSAIDQGKIILTTMPQKFQTERRYVNTFLKLLYYNHALRRFDKTKGDRAKDNLLILWADEAQRFMTASEDGTSDYNCVDVIREAGATIVAAAQSTTSLIPPLGNDKSKVLTLNLRNRMIFRSADEADAPVAGRRRGRELAGRAEPLTGHGRQRRALHRSGPGEQRDIGRVWDGGQGFVCRPAVGGDHQSARRNIAGDEQHRPRTRVPGARRWSCGAVGTIRPVERGRIGGRRRPAALTRSAQEETSNCAESARRLHCA